jgi:hypothetical protein
MGRTMRGACEPLPCERVVAPHPWCPERATPRYPLCGATTLSLLPSQALFTGFVALRSGTVALDFAVASARVVAISLDVTPGSDFFFSY